MVCTEKPNAIGGAGLMEFPGVDACNTVLEVLLFAAAMNLGQGWNTILTLFGGMEYSYF